MTLSGNKPFPSANDDEYATLGTGLKGALIKSGDTLKSLAFVYTDAYCCTVEKACSKAPAIGLPRARY